MSEAEIMGHAAREAHDAGVFVSNVMALALGIAGVPFVTRKAWAEQPPIWVKVLGGIWIAFWCVPPLGRLWAAAVLS